MSDKRSETRNAERFGPSRYISPAEIAHHVRRSRPWVYSKIASGELPARRVCGVLRVERAAFEAWLAAVTEPAA